MPPALCVANTPLSPMRIFHVLPGAASEGGSLQSVQSAGLPAQGFLWIACTRDEFKSSLAEIQEALLHLCDAALLELHVSDLLNQQLRSHYDYTSDYDLMVFRRLATAGHKTSAAHDDTTPLAGPAASTKRSGPPILRRIDTSPIGFAVYDRVLLTVHPDGCAVREAFESKIMQPVVTERLGGARLPNSPADLMLRLINLIVDGYLDLRKELTHQLDHWQAELLEPQTRFNNWAALLNARQSLHALDDICEEQRSGIQDWIEAVKTWPETTDPAQAKERELLQVRSRDVLEHIERVVHHVRRLEQSIEAAIQMHFSAQSHRTNDIMRTLTAVTAIFLPLNLIAAIFGMNFDSIPLLHRQTGFWWAMGSMAFIALTLALIFWRKRYLARSPH